MKPWECTFVVAILTSSALCCAAQPVHPPVIAGQYSSIRYISEADDLVGYDVRVLRVGQRYSITLYCAEGTPGQPLKQLVQVRNNVVTLAAPEGFCARQIRLHFVRNGVLIRLDADSADPVPRHPNYLKKEYWK